MTPSLVKYVGSKVGFLEAHAALLPMPAPGGVVAVAFVGSGPIAAHYRSRGCRVIASDIEESLGAPLGDVWTDIGVIAPRARERTGYPTQKPEALLERIVTLRSLPGDLVIDPTCGSGTTAAVADRLGRRAVGIDRSEVAIRVARGRLALSRAEGM